MRIALIGRNDSLGLLSAMQAAIAASGDHTCTVVTLLAGPGASEFCLQTYAGDFSDVDQALRAADAIQFTGVHWARLWPFGPLRWGDYVDTESAFVYVGGDPPLDHPRRVSGMIESGVPVCFANPLTAVNYPGAALVPVPLADVSRCSRDLPDTKDRPVRIGCVDDGRPLRAGVPLLTRAVGVLRAGGLDVELDRIAVDTWENLIGRIAGCDIFFDRISPTGCPSFRSYAAWMLGVPSLAYSSTEYEEAACAVLNCSALPVVHADPQTLEPQLRRLLLDEEALAEAGEDSLSWARQYQTPEATLGRYIDYCLSVSEVAEAVVDDGPGADVAVVAGQQGGTTWP